jgi:hypothetical protein
MYMGADVCGGASSGGSIGSYDNSMSMYGGANWMPSMMTPMNLKNFNACMTGQVSSILKTNSTIPPMFNCFKVFATCPPPDPRQEVLYAL